MSDDASINEDLLAIVKALADKVENLEKTLYAKDSLLMKAGLVVSQSPTPTMNRTIGGASTLGDISRMEWNDIHKMIKEFE
jgi:hypothetical protein